MDIFPTNLRISLSNIVVANIVHILTFIYKNLQHNFIKLGWGVKSTAIFIKRLFSRWIPLNLYHKASWQSIARDMGQLGPFRASEDILAQKMVTLSATIALLQMMSILPTMGLCRTCKVPTPKWKEENWIFWECGTCPSASGKKFF